eukprot:4446102-Pyramimonas_sp.AAC.1
MVALCHALPAGVARGVEAGLGGVLVPEAHAVAHEDVVLEAAAHGLVATHVLFPVGEGEVASRGGVDHVLVRDTHLTPTDPCSFVNGAESTIR